MALPCSLALGCAYLEASGREPLDLRQRDAMFGGMLERMRQKGGTADILSSSSMMDACSIAKM